MMLKDFGQGRESKGGTFLPEEYVRGREDIRTNFIAVLLFVVVMFCVVSAFWITNKRWVDVRDRQDQINEEFNLVKVEEEELRRLEASRRTLIERQAVATALRDPTPRLLLLQALDEARPSDLELGLIELRGRRLQTAQQQQQPRQAGQVRSLSRTANVNQQNQQSREERPAIAPPRFEFTMNIQGVSPTNTAVADYYAALRRSPILKDVELRRIAETRRDNRELRRFEMTASLRDDGPLLRSLAQAEGVVEPDEAVSVEAVLEAAAAAGDTPEDTENTERSEVAGVDAGKEN